MSGLYIKGVISVHSHFNRETDSSREAEGTHIISLVTYIYLLLQKIRIGFSYPDHVLVGKR